jgi:hypothetical protein
MYVCVCLDAVRCKVVCDTKEIQVVAVYILMLASLSTALCVHVQ